MPVQQNSDILRITVISNFGLCTKRKTSAALLDCSKLIKLLVTKYPSSAVPARQPGRSSLLLLSLLSWQTVRKRNGRGGWVGRGGKDINEGGGRTNPPIHHNHFASFYFLLPINTSGWSFATTSWTRLPMCWKSRREAKLVLIA